MIDTEGYEIRRMPWWWSPLTQKQVHMDTYSMLSYWRWMVEADIIRFCRERGFVGEEYLLLEGEFDRGELQEREAMFRVDQTKPITIRRYPLDIELIPEVYTPRLLEEELLTTYTIIEKLEYLKIILTFSIETGTGHDVPFFAEVTCDTTVQAVADRAEIERRVVNAVLKWFFIVFDAFKIVRTADVPDRHPQVLIDYVRYLQVHAEPIREVEWRTFFREGRTVRVKRGMDGFFTYREHGVDIMELILTQIAIEGPEYFITRESFIAIGAEYGTADFEYEYPTVHVIIEKTRPTRYRVERTLILAPATNVWLDEILNMVISYGGRA